MTKEKTREWFRADEALAREKQGWGHVSCEEEGISKLNDMALMEKEAEVVTEEEVEEAPKKRGPKPKK